MTRAIVAGVDGPGCSEYPVERAIELASAAEDALLVSCAVPERRECRRSFTSPTAM